MSNFITLFLAFKIFILIESMLEEEPLLLEEILLEEGPLLEKPLDYQLKEKVEG